MRFSFQERDGRLVLAAPPLDMRGLNVVFAPHASGSSSTTAILLASTDPLDANGKCLQLLSELQAGTGGQRLSSGDVIDSTAPSPGVRPPAHYDD